MSGFLRFAKRAALLGGAAFAAYSVVKRRSSGSDEPAPMGAEAAPAPIVPGSSTAPETVMPEGAEFNDRIGARTIGES
jgi:hypothetical protein